MIRVKKHIARPATARLLLGDLKLSEQDHRALRDLLPLAPSGATRTPSRRMRQSAVFINHPFGSAFAKTFIAFIAGIVGLGRRPRCVLEIADGGQGRLSRIIRLIEECDASIHELGSCVRVRSETEPRFNMPFELGLACLVSESSARQHRYFVFEKKRWRLQRILSDLNGIDPLIHDGSAKAVLRRILDCFGSGKQTPSLRQLLALHDKLARKLRKRKTSVFEPHEFRLAVGLAVRLAQQMEIIAA